MDFMKLDRQTLKWLAAKIVQAALQHPHAFGEQVEIASISVNYDILQTRGFYPKGILPLSINGQVLRPNTRYAWQRYLWLYRNGFRCTYQLDTQNPYREMPIDLRLNDGHTVVCGTATMIGVEEGGYYFKIRT